jgi:hypothetical protein
MVDQDWELVHLAASTGVSRPSARAVYPDITIGSGVSSILAAVLADLSRSQAQLEVRCHPLCHPWELPCDGEMHILVGPPVGLAKGSLSAESEGLGGGYPPEMAQADGPAQIVGWGATIVKVDV